MSKSNIKLSKIELEAFRGYKDKVVFDFTLPTSEIADIVAIYAPNGFGKTSFFDGIEWNTKGCIERFEENSKIKNAAREFGGSILKNRESHLENGTVSIFDSNNLNFTRYTSSSENWDLLSGRIERRSTSPIREISNYKKFKRIEILPQSRIDSFLSSNTPEEKYQALLDFWDGNDESNYFVGVSKFHEESEKEEEKIASEIKELNDRIVGLTTSESKLAFLNILVDIINSSEENSIIVPGFTVDTSELEFEHIVRVVNSNVASISSKLRRGELARERLITLEDGLAVYIGNNKYASNLKIEIEASQAILNNFIELENKQIEKRDLDLKLQKEQIDLDETKSISVSKNAYSAIEKQIKELIDERASITHAKIQLIEQKNSSEKELKNKADSLRSLVANEIKYSENIERQLGLLTTIETNKGRSESSSSRLQLCNKLRVARNNSAYIIRRELNAVQSLISFNLELFCSTEYTYSEFEDLASELKREFFELSALSERLRELRSDYSKRGNLNEDLEKIVELGRNLISQTETNICPLCNTRQDDFNKLLSRISSQRHDVLNLSQSFEMIQSRQTDIEERTEVLNNRYEYILTKFRQKSSKLTKDLNAVSSKISAIDTLISYYTSIETLAAEENERLGMQDISIQSENSTLKVQLEDNENSKQNLSLAINDIKAQLDAFEKEILYSEHRLQSIGSNVEQLSQNPLYITVNSFLKGKAISAPDYLESGLNLLVIETERSVQLFRNRSSLLQKQIDGLIEDTKNENKDVVQKDLIEKTATLRTVEEKIAQYRSQYKSVTDLDNIENGIIEKSIATNEKFVSNLKSIDFNLRELQSNIHFIQQNIELNKLRSEFKAKQERLNSTKQTTQKLGQLKTDLSDFLTEKINSVFNQEIINDIYRKIDPHPDFRKIKLEPHFDGIKPKLFIRAVDDDKEDEIDPILYLSSAQINILSLSIFLAKALQNKDVMINTIFMDDPIQYLDSINVLSFIDLLRSITTDKQLDRQVVISTHDENFFNLLRKKLDPRHYNSKFIEFESYGKLKPN
jgi:DNA repair protein SbcC/Rad50